MFFIEKVCYSFSKTQCFETLLPDCVVTQPCELSAVRSFQVQPQMRLLSDSVASRLACTYQ